MIPIISGLLESTVGKVVGKLVDKYLPKSMDEKEKAEMLLEMEKLVLEEGRILQEEMESINKTMQAEAQSTHFITYGWRPIIGLTFAAVIINNYLLIPYLTSYGIVPINMPSEVWNAMLVILGAASAFRGWKQVEEAKKGK